MADIRPPDECLLKALHIEERLLAGAGPSGPSPRIRAAVSLPQVMGLQSVGLSSVIEVMPIMTDVRAGIQYGFQTSSPHVFCVTGGGHAAAESMCVSLLEPGEVFMICENGFWGKRMKEIAERQDVDIRTLKKCYGEVFSVDEVEKGLKKHQPKVMFIAHGESTAGILQPIDKLGQLCHKYGCLLMVDSIAAMGAVPLYMDKWEIDVVFSGAPKVLNAPAGLNPVAIAPAAWSKITNRHTKIRSLFLDATLLAKMWGCLDQPPVYQHTPLNINIYGLREAFACLAEEGLKQSWEKHKRCASLLYKGLEELDVELFVKDVELRLPTVTTLRVPEDLKDRAAYVLEYMLKSLNVGISMNESPVGTLWRIGLMGYNATPENVQKVLSALRTGFDWARTRTLNAAMR